MKTKFKKAIFLAISTFALALGFSGANKEKEVTVNAAPITTGTVLYFKPTPAPSGWLQAGAKMCIKLWNDQGEVHFAEMSLGTSTTLFYYEVPVSTKGSFDNLWFGRNDPDLPIDEANTWNRTANLTFDGTNNLYVLPNATQWMNPGDNWFPYDSAPYAVDEIPASTELYFRPAADFYNEGGYSTSFAAYFFNTDGKNVWVNPTYPYTSTYKVVTPTLEGGVLPNYVIFASMRAGTSGNSFENVLAQTADLYPDLTLTKPMYYGPSQTWKELPTFANYQNLAEGINANKIRIWLDRNGHYATNSYTYLLFFNTNHHCNTGKEKAIELTSGDPVDYLYYDVPISWIKNKEVGITIVNEYNEVLVSIPAQTFVEGDNSKLWKINLSGETWSYEKTVVSEKVYNTFVRKVLEGYLSCSPSVDNGYGAFNLMDNTFIPKIDAGGTTIWNMSGTLGGQTLNDYASVEAYETGERTVEVDAYVKYQMLAANYLANSGGGGASFSLMNSSNNTPLILMFIFSLIGVGFISYLRLKKYKN